MKRGGAVLGPCVALALAACGADAPVSAMQADLRNLANAEEAYFTFNHTYSVGEGLDFTASPGVTVTINGATGTGWYAVASHNASSRTCGIFAGSAPNPTPDGTPGQPSCR